MQHHSALRGKIARGIGRPIWQSSILPVIGLLFFGLSGASTARGAQITFAQFVQTNPGATFAWTDNTTFGSAAIQNFSTEVTFSFTSASGLSTATHAATLTLSALSNSPATTGTIGGSQFDSQPINGDGNPSSDLLSVVDNSTGQTLLSMTFTGTILGVAGTGSATLSGNSDPAVANTVNFSSSYLNFNNSDPNSYQIGLSSITPSLSIGPGGFLNSFTTGETAAFSATVISVPEPSSLALFGVAVLMLCTRPVKGCSSVK